ncbi:MAG: hypothetical protein GC154_21710 [bacterium]|nr:hypothetical protein [bacterium]
MVSLIGAASAQVVISELLANRDAAWVDDDGDASDWIELHNTSSQPVSLEGWSLSDDTDEASRWIMPAVSIPPDGYMLIYASGKNRVDPSKPLHTSFSLSSSGEFLALYDASGAWVSGFEPAYPPQDVHRGVYSYGYDAVGEAKYFLTPTPGAANGDGVIGFTSPVSFSVSHGFFDAPINVELTAEPGAAIYYTLNGSAPNETNGERYASPISIDSTSMLRASAVKPGYQIGDPVTNTYIFLDQVIRQTRPEDYPTTWANGVSGDYNMDQRVVNNADYRDTIKDDLKSIPSMSIVMDINDLFGRRDGIYVHPESKGITWERPASVELIKPDGSEGFQLNCGIRIQGGYSRVPNQHKHSFRLLFKADYGPTDLEYPVFPDYSVQKFEQLVLRGSYNYSWHASEGGFGSNIGKAEYMRDEYGRRTLIALGQPGSMGGYVHLYLNGMYWGLYDMCERPDDGFSAIHMGGDKSEWDVITGGSRGINQIQVKAGTDETYRKLMNMVARREYRTDAGYEEIQKYVNLDNLIDYMLLIFFIGNRDAPTVIGGGGTPWNFYSSYRRTRDDGFRFYAWDSEWSLEEPDRNVIEFHRGVDNPATVFQALRELPEFKIRVADHIQRHFFGDGPLTAENAQARYLKIAAEIDRAIVGESARWGDANSSSPHLRSPDWTNERDRIAYTYFPQRTGIVLQQLRDAGLYPTIDAPSFDREGGVVERGAQVALEAPQAPRVSTSPIIDYIQRWKYNQDGVDLGTAWREPGYDDDLWPWGRGALGVESSALPQTIRTTLNLGQPTYYFRATFFLNASEIAQTQRARLYAMVDDGAIVYINGQEAYRVNMPDGPVNFNTYANNTVGNAEISEPIDLPKEFFHEGSNVIAVEVHQTNANSSDIVMGLAIEAITEEEPQNDTPPIYYTLDGSDPRLPGGEVNPEAVRYDQPITINQSTQIRARVFSNDEWSALDEAVFYVQQNPGDLAFMRQNLRLTEVMYNPPAGAEMEFVELHNASSQAIPLGGVAFSNGVTYQFPPAASIAPGEYILVTPSPDEQARAVFRAFYGLPSSLRIFGPYTGKLANEGEQLALSSIIDGENVFSITYGDGRAWPKAADGAGHSLVPLAYASEGQANDLLEYPYAWRASAFIDGSPGEADPEPLQTLIVNEFAALTGGVSGADPANDWVEIFNNSPNTVSLADYYLSDTDADLRLYKIPAVEIEPYGYLVLDDQSNFQKPFDSGFGLGKDGDQIFLSYLPGQRGVDRVVDAVDFKAQELNVSLGRTPNAGRYWSAMEPTRGAANEAKSLDVFIDEFMYNPTVKDIGENNLGEYIEIANPYDVPVPLYNARGPWRVSGAASFDFPENLTIPEGGRVLLVGFDPNDSVLMLAFESAYGLSEKPAIVLGPFKGNLSNKGEHIALERPQAVAAVDEGLAWVVVDEVNYFDRDPWPDGADGTGKSFQRLSTRQNGNDPAAWQVASPTPGKRNESVGVTDWALY